MIAILVTACQDNVAMLHTFFLALLLSCREDKFIIEAWEILKPVNDCFHALFTPLANEPVRYSHARHISNYQKWEWSKELHNSASDNRASDHLGDHAYVLCTVPSENPLHQQVISHLQELDG